MMAAAICTGGRCAAALGDGTGGPQGEKARPAPGRPGLASQPIIKIA